MAAGVLWRQSPEPALAAPQAILGRSPGDIVVARENFRSYLQLGSSLPIRVAVQHAVLQGEAMVHRHQKRRRKRHERARLGGSRS